MDQTGGRVNAQKILSEKPPSQRQKIAVRLGRRLKGDLTRIEQQMIWAIARHLAEDVAQMVREELAKSLRECTYLPKDIGFQLACDIDSVAAPFLETTQIFSDEELFEIARSVTDTIRLVIAGRPSLSGLVSSALIELGNLKVAETLMSNRSAKVLEQDYRVLFDRFPCEQTLFQRMAARSMLPPTIVTELIGIVSEELRLQLQTKYKIKENYAALITDEVHESALLRAIGACPENQVSTLTRIIQSKGRLTRNLCFLAIRNGHLTFFESALAALSGQPEDYVRHHGRNGELDVLVEICEKAKIPEFVTREICDRVLSIRQEEQRISA